MSKARVNRTGRRVAAVLWLAALLALSGGAVAIGATASSTSLAGTWTGKYSGAYAGTFRLRWSLNGSKLVGSIALSNPRGTFPINGSVTRGKIKFGVVGAGATYRGTVVGKSMSGTYLTGRGGGSWSAHKVS